MTQPDFRALCAQMLAAWEQGDDIVGAMNRARAALAEGETGPRLWTEGICGDGAALLRDGVMIPIEEIVAELNRGEQARAALAATPPRPVPVSERPWEREGWCDARGLCWWSLGTTERWTLCRPHGRTVGWMLPAHAIPTPENTDD